VVLGTLFAVLFDQFLWQERGHLAGIAPFFVMPTVSALIWKNMMMHPVYGFLAVFMNKLGLQPIDWFSTHPLYPSSSLCRGGCLCLSDFVYLVKSLDQEQKEAAAVDRQSVQFFFYVTSRI
jgi:sorbitol/mannitol transport system permease protein